MTKKTRHPAVLGSPEGRNVHANVWVHLLTRCTIDNRPVTGHQKHLRHPRKKATEGDEDKAPLVLFVQFDVGG